MITDNGVILSLIEDLEQEAYNSCYHVKAGDPVRLENDKITYITVGHRANAEQVEEYGIWESTRMERRSIVSRMQQKYHMLEFKIDQNFNIEIYNKKPKNTLDNDTQ